MGRMNWNGDAFMEAMEARYSARVEAGANLLAQRMRERIGIQGPPRSLPGESPHRDTGNLQANVEINGPEIQGSKIIASVGTSLAYGLYLELGTEKMQQRAWMLPTLLENGPEVASVIAEGQTILT